MKCQGEEACGSVASLGACEVAKLERRASRIDKVGIAPLALEVMSGKSPVDASNVSDVEPGFKVDEVWIFVRCERQQEP